MDFVDEYSANSTSIQRALKLKRPDFRMRDAEMLVRYLAFRFFLPTYVGNLKDFLNDACKQMDGGWDTQENEIRAAAKACDDAIDTTIEIFGRFAFRRWSIERFEGPFNRAVFDVMTFYFSDAKVAEKARGMPVEVMGAFKELCRNDQDFVDAIQSTTKSVTATSNRLAKWGTTLGNLIGLDLAPPQVVDGRIVR